MAHLLLLEGIELPPSAVNEPLVRDALPLVLVVDPTGTLVSCSGPIEELGVFVGRSVFELPSPFEAIGSAFRRALDDEPTAVDIEVHGEIFAVRHVATRGPSGDIGGAVAVGTNVTALRRAERDLARAKHHLASAERVTHTGSWHWDLETGDVYDSQELLRMHGLESTEGSRAYTSLIELVHPDDRERLIANIAQHSHLGTAGDDIYRIIRPDGTVRVLHSRSETLGAPGQPRSIVGAVQDVTEQFDLRAALALQGALFESQIEASADGIVVVEASDAVLAVNRKLGAVLGVDVADIATEGELLSIVDSCCAEPEGALALRRSSGQPRTVRGDLALRNGRFVEWSATPVVHQQGRPSGRMWHFRDVTSRKQAEVAAAQSERFMRVVIDTIPCALSLMHDGRYIVANQAFAELAGIPLDVIPQIDLEQARGVTPSLDEALKECEQVIASRQAHFEPVKALVLPSGEPRSFQTHRIPVELPGRGMGVLTVGMDITQRIAAEAAHARSEAQFRQLIEALPDCIAIHRSGVVLYCNAAVATALGHDDPASLRGMRVAEFIHPDDRACVAERVHAVAGSAEPGPLEEFRAIRSDGRELIFEAVAMRIDFQGAPAVVTMARDVTERKAMQSRMLQADRMASIGTLAAGVAHEINNPLAYIATNIEVAAERLAKLERAPQTEAALHEVSAALADARQGAERVRVIVRDLKTFSRADDVERRVSVDVRAVLDSALQMASNEIRHRATLVKEYGPVPNVEANDSRLAQVFLNMVVNAAHAIQDGLANHNEIRVATRTDASGRAVVEIADTGCGMTPEVLRRVFDPFFTTKAVGQGTGLGLSISQGIVEALGGEIQLESTPGRGTTFRVVMPAHEAPVEAVVRTIATSSPAPASTGSILLVDDDPAIARLVRRVLSGCELDVASSGRELIEQLHVLRKYDVILCDLMMPEVSGMALHARVLVEDPAVASRFVFITGGAFTPEARQFLDVVPNPTLGKPFSASELRTLVAARLALSVSQAPGGTKP